MILKEGLVLFYFIILYASSGVQLMCTGIFYNLAQLINHIILLISRINKSLTSWEWLWLMWLREIVELRGIVHQCMVALVVATHTASYVFILSNKEVNAYMKRNYHLIVTIRRKHKVFRWLFWWNFLWFCVCECKFSYVWVSLQTPSYVRHLFMQVLHISTFIIESPS